jgi:hypothetical protein
MSSRTNGNRKMGLSDIDAGGRWAVHMVRGIDRAGELDLEAETGVYGTA